MTACKKLKRGQKFTIEELYQNKNFVQPKEKNLETIFEEPKQSKDGAAVLTSVRKYRRYLDFDPTVGKIQKRKRNAKKCVNKIGGKRSRTRSATKIVKLEDISIILDALSDSSDDSVLETTQAQTDFKGKIKYLRGVDGRFKAKNTVNKDSNVKIKNISDDSYVEVRNFNKDSNVEMKNFSKASCVGINTFTRDCENSIVERKYTITENSENCEVEMNNTIIQDDNTNVEINNTIAEKPVMSRLHCKSDGLANIDNVNKCKKCMVSANICICRNLTETSAVEQEPSVTEKITSDRADGSPLKSCITM